MFHTQEQQGRVAPASTRVFFPPSPPLPPPLPPRIVYVFLLTDFWLIAHLGMASLSSRSLLRACRLPRAGPPPVRPFRDGLFVFEFCAFVLDFFVLFVITLTPALSFFFPQFGLTSFTSSVDPWCTCSWPLCGMASSSSCWSSSVSPSPSPLNAGSLLLPVPVLALRPLRECLLLFRLFNFGSINSRFVLCVAPLLYKDQWLGR